MAYGRASSFCIIFSFLFETGFAQTTGGLPAIRPSQSPPKIISPQRAAEPRSSVPNKNTLNIQAASNRTLINEGWYAFIGANGFVDEKNALRYTLAAIDRLKDQTSDADKRLLSYAQNNLTVIYLCAVSPNVRDIVAGINYQPDLNSYFAIDNFIWAVFLRRESVENLAEFNTAILKFFPDHPVTRYVSSLGGKLPTDVQAAYDFLTDMSMAGDPNAAMRLGFRQECGFSDTNIEEAILWYGRARDLQVAIGANPQVLKGIEDRIKRLKLFMNGRVKK